MDEGNKYCCSIEVLFKRCGDRERQRFDDIKVAEERFFDEIWSCLDGSDRILQWNRDRSWLIAGMNFRSSCVGFGENKEPRLPNGLFNVGVTRIKESEWFNWDR